jgi:hypothetical protein
MTSSDALKSAKIGHFRVNVCNLNFLYRNDEDKVARLERDFKIYQDSSNIDYDVIGIVSTPPDVSQQEEKILGKEYASEIEIVHGKARLLAARNINPNLDLTWGIVLYRRG